MSVRLSRWFLFTVVASLAPLFILYLLAAFQNHFLDLTDLAKEGDLLIIGVVIATEGLGGVIDAPASVWKNLIVLGCAATILAGSVFYTLGRLGPPADFEYFRNFSVSVWLAGVIAALACKLLEEFS